ncbi:MAG TPA: hypothetical protein VKO86_11680 [Gemmatimonadales bacterium]|nr:hypothetical protein [Gemmatimonadales bacterium]
MLQYPLEMPGGHLILRHNGQAMLLDTGSPVSIGRRTSYRFLDREIPVLQRYQGMTLEQWSEHIGVDIDALLGCDVLGRYAVAIHPMSGYVVFDEDPRRLRPRAAPLETVAGMPVVEVGLAGRKLRVLFHTGATLSCLRDVDTRAHRCVGVARDCYPGTGEFATELRLVPLMFGDQPVNLECGQLPSAIEQALRPLEVHGIVGTDLLRTFTVGWGRGFSELRLVTRPTFAAPVRLVRLAVIQ